MGRRINLIANEQIKTGKNIEREQNVYYSRNIFFAVGIFMTLITCPMIVFMMMNIAYFYWSNYWVASIIIMVALYHIVDIFAAVTGFPLYKWRGYYLEKESFEYLARIYQKKKMIV